MCWVKSRRNVFTRWRLNMKPSRKNSRHSSITVLGLLTYQTKQKRHSRKSATMQTFSEIINPYLTAPNRAFFLLALIVITHGYMVK